MTGCGDSACLYSKSSGGMSTNGGCICDECPRCGKSIRGPGFTFNTHRTLCPNPDWVPPHWAEWFERVPKVLAIFGAVNGDYPTAAFEWMKAQGDGTYTDWRQLGLLIAYRRDAIG